MNLTRHQRKQLFDGEPAKITFDGAKPCPIEVGHVERLSANVWFVVTDTRRSKPKPGKPGEHVLVYTLHNNRLGQRFLATQHGQYYPQQYAHSGGSGVDSEAGEAVDAFTQKRLTEEAKKRNQDAIGDLLGAMEEVRDAMEQRAKDHPEIRRELFAVRSRIVEVQRKLRRRLAA